MILIQLPTVLVTFHLDKPWSGPLLGRTQHTSNAVGSGPKVRVEIDASVYYADTCNRLNGASELDLGWVHPWVDLCLIGLGREITAFSWVGLG